MSGLAWSAPGELPAWLWDLEPATTGLLGQSGVRLWTAGDRAALGIRAGGVVYPVLPGGVDGVAQGARDLLNRVTASWCLMGPLEWVTAAEALMPPSWVHHRIDYEFLVRPRADVAVAPGPGALRRAQPSDANALFPLQAGYEKEEVLFSPADFQPLACRLHLGKLLKIQVLVGLWENGRPVAKAGTNALTPHWAQIGGVYTQPEHRGRGHQTRLMAYLLEVLGSQGRSSCLFVKKTNDAALGLYRKLGFHPEGAFRICYGERKPGS